jgi:hypothetical protein
MTLAMRSVLSFAIMMLALLAFCAPSLARGLDAVITPAEMASITMASDSGAAIVAPGCKQGSGKRVMPCHPDLGVLTAGMAVLDAAATPLFGLPESLLAAASWPDAELPPPRRG